MSDTTKTKKPDATPSNVGGAPTAEIKPGGTAKAKVQRRMPSWLQTLSSIERRLSAMSPEMARQSLILLGGQYGLTLTAGVNGEAKA